MIRASPAPNANPEPSTLMAASLFQAKQFSSEMPVIRASPPPNANPEPRSSGSSQRIRWRSQTLNPDCGDRPVGADCALSLNLRVAGEPPSPLKVEGATPAPLPAPTKTHRASRRQSMNSQGSPLAGTLKKNAPLDRGVWGVENPKP